MGQSPDSSSYNENKDGLPFFQGNADFGELYPKVRVWCNAPKKLAEPDDILISVRAPIGALNYTKGCCCIGRGLAAITVKNPLDRNFVFHLLKARNDYLNQQGTGSTFKAIGKNVLEEILVPIVSDKAKKNFVNAMDLTESIIRNRRAELSHLDDLVKARFVEMFGDVVSNEKNWSISRLGDVTTSRLGKMLDAKQQTGEYAFPYLANFNVQWFHFDLSRLNEMDFCEADQKEFSLQEGDLLVTEGGEVGRCAVWHNEVTPCFYQKALHRVRCNTDVLVPDYLAWWFKMQSEYNGFSDVVGATSIAHLPGVKLKALKVVIPPIEMQKEFTTFAKQVDKSKVAVQESLNQAQLLFDSLMQKYFG